MTYLMDSTPLCMSCEGHQEDTMESYVIVPRTDNGL